MGNGVFQARRTVVLKNAGRKKKASINGKKATGTILVTLTG